MQRVDLSVVFAVLLDFSSFLESKSQEDVAGCTPGGCLRFRWVDVSFRESLVLALKKTSRDSVLCRRTMISCGTALARYSRGSSTGVPCIMCMMYVMCTYAGGLVESARRMLDGAVRYFAPRQRESPKNLCRAWSWRLLSMALRVHV